MPVGQRVGMIEGDENLEGARSIEDDFRCDLDCVLSPLLICGRTRQAAAEQNDDDNNVWLALLGCTRLVNT